MPEGGSLFNRLRALFLRYASHHETRACGVGLPRHRLRRVGNIETVRVVEDGLRLSGWCRTGTVRFSWPDGQLDVRPDLPRSDVGRRIGSASHNLGFDVTLPRQAHPLRIATLLPSGAARHVTISHPADPGRPGRGGGCAGPSAAT
jgi:hypothetical protein